MSGLWTIAKRELRALFDHPTGYILLVVFLVINDFLFFRQAYLTGVASLRPMLQLLPWILLFFVPAATMRAVAEDAREGVLEVVLAHPVTEVEFVGGKYLGQLFFIWIGLALTLPVAFGLSLGADLQVGVMVAQYVGAALLAAALTAIGIWASSITPHQITAFIVGVAVMFVFILVGVDPIISGLPVLLSRAVESLAILRHFESIGRGVIDLRDVIYFVTLAGLFLAFAYGAVMRRKLSPTGGARKRLRLGLWLLTATLVVVNLFGRNIGGRLDLTPGHAYTLSKATKQIVRNVPDIVTITFYVSDEVPPQAAVIKRDIEDLLSDLRSAGHGNIRVVRVDPKTDSTALAEARSLNIPPVQFNVVGESELQVKEGYLGLAVRYADGVETIPFVQRTEDLEYRLVSFIRSLTRTDKPVVGIVDATNTPGMPPQQQAPGGQYQALRQALGEQHEVRTLSVNDSTPIADDVDALVLIGAPTMLGDTETQRFESFLDRGHGALVLASGNQIDPRQGMMAQSRPVAWNTLLQPYGVSIRLDVLYDLASNERVSFAVQGGRLLTSYPFWVRALSTRESPVNQDIESLVLPWASGIDTSRAKAGTVVPLFTTSQAGGAERGQVFITPQRSFPREGLEPQIAAVLVNPLAAADTTDVPNGRVIVVGNSEFASDQSTRSDPGGLVFVLNAVDWLVQDEALIEIRSKDRQPPPLVKSPGRDAAVKYGNVIGVPILLVLFGGARLLRRRRLAGQSYAAHRRGGDA